MLKLAPITVLVESPIAVPLSSIASASSFEAICLGISIILTILEGNGSPFKPSNSPRSS